MLALLLLIAAPAGAHKPSFSNGQYSGPERAYPVRNIDHSIVVYHEITCADRQLWLRFSAPDAGARLFVQLGVPKIDRLERYHPILAVIAPGLPAPQPQLPFAIPAGMGVEMLRAEVARAFHEPFTGTDSWILVERTLTLPSAGTGYIVAWEPEARPGKVWVAVGEKEVFGLTDLLRFVGWRASARDFHEVGEAPAGGPAAPCD
jgi:hypothetical protein